MSANNAVVVILPGVVVAVGALVVFFADLFVARKAVLAWVAAAGVSAGGRDPREHGLARHEQVGEEDDESAHGHDHAGQDHDDGVVGAHLEQPPGPVSYT